MSLQLGRDGLAIARGSIESVTAGIRSARRLLPAFARTDAALPADLRLALGALPLVESLETRQMMAAAPTSTASLSLSRSGSTLNVVGNGSQANAVSLTRSSDGKTFTVRANAQTATYNVADITRLNFTGGNAADYVNVDQALALTTSINTNGGNDTVLGGGGTDWVHGGGDNDWVEGRAGWDYVYGGDGNDTVSGGTGNDQVRGHGGNDSLDGGDGYDVIQGNGEYDVAMNGESYSEVETRKTGTIAPLTFTSSTTTTGGSTGSTGGSTGSTGGSTGTATGATIPVVANANAPVARITAVTSSTILAGQAFHVDALTSTLNYGQPTAARFEWNFGDAGSDYNTLVGYNAAHVYARAGTYTVSLRVINEAGKASTTTTQVTVNADTRPAIYVSAAGNDANDGSSTAKAVKTWARATSLVYESGGKLKVLFRAGDTFDVSNEMLVRSNDVLVGSYGAGNSPVLRYVGARTKNSWIITAASESVTGLTVQGLTFDSIYSGDTEQTYMPTAITVRGRNSLVLNNVFRNVGYAINVSGSSVGTLAQGNNAPLATGIRGYFMWSEGRNVVALNNTVANSTREHNIRLSGTEHALIYDNDLTNLDRTGSGDRNDNAKATVNVQKGSYVYVSGNRLNGASQFGPLGTDANIAEKATRTTYGVFEGNVQVSGLLKIFHGAEHIMLRNNVFELDNEVQIEVEGYNAYFGRGVVDLSIINNTGLNEGATGSFLRTSTPVEGIRLLNNLYVAPNLYTGAYVASPVQIWDADMSNFTAVNANNWGDPSKYAWAQGGINWVGTVSASSSYRTAAEWNALNGVGTDLFVDVGVSGAYKPSGSDAVVNAGVAVGGVFVDFYGTPRDLSGWTIGAVQV